MPNTDVLIYDNVEASSGALKMWIQSWEKTIQNVWQMKAQEQQEDELH